ncbi:MAG: hypothetical protein KGZ25_15790 [Planctomycetes bacterium]|nr:hypothetical protein [Planctomycetota bacterium]
MDKKWQNTSQKTPEPLIQNGTLDLDAAVEYFEDLYRSDASICHVCLAEVQNLTGYAVNTEANPEVSLPSPVSISEIQQDHTQRAKSLTDFESVATLQAGYVN